MADQNENLLTLQQLNQVLGLQTETLTNKMGQVFEDKMNQVFEDKLQIAEGESVNLPNVERQVGLLLGATPDAILQPLSQNVVGRGSRITEVEAVRNDVGSLDESRVRRRAVVST